jgi:hypothetical protein
MAVQVPQTQGSAVDQRVGGSAGLAFESVDAGTGGLRSDGAGVHAGGNPVGFLAVAGQVLGKGDRPQFLVDAELRGLDVDFGTARSSWLMPSSAGLMSTSCSSPLSW